MPLPFLILPHTLGQPQMYISNQSCCSTMVLTLGEYEYNGTTYDLSQLSGELMYSSYAKFQDYFRKPRVPFEFPLFPDDFHNELESKFFLYTAIDFFSVVSPNYYFYPIHALLDPNTDLLIKIISEEPFNCGFENLAVEFHIRYEPSLIKIPIDGHLRCKETDDTSEPLSAGWIAFIVLLVPFLGLTYAFLKTRSKPLTFQNLL